MDAALRNDLPAGPAQARAIAGRLDGLCRELGTRLDSASFPWAIAPAGAQADLHEFTRQLGHGQRPRGSTG